eukprot:9448926-Heterocapsa_arctica.AAC.1
MCSNKSAGVSILVRRSLIKGKHLNVLDSGPPEIAGRVLATRWKGPTFDYTIMAMYFPPKGATMSTKDWRKCVDLMIGWARQQLQRAPHRSTPIIGVDLNDEMGAAKEGVGLEDLRSTAVGRPGGRAEGYAAK